MKPEKPKNLGFKQIYFNLDKILFLFFLIFMMIEFVWLPLNSWIAGLLLRQTGYLFLSYNNIFAIIKGSPFVSLALFVLVIVNLLVAYYQIGLLFIGARHLLYHERRTLLEYSRKVSPKFLVYEASDDFQDSLYLLLCHDALSIDSKDFKDLLPQ